MARSIQQIQQQILDQALADPVLSPLLTSTSKRAIYILWSYIQATAIAMVEQLIDIATALWESIAAKAAPATPNWLQDQIFKFQYSATTPQIIQFINFAPAYPVVDPTLRIITRCSISTTLSGRVLIKVAKGDPPGPLSGPEIAALTAYINPPNGEAIAGVNYVISSKNADKLYIAAQVFYQGQYSSVIQFNVITAIETFLANIPFNGQMKVSDLEVAIKGVPGVNDVVLNNVVARPDLVAFGGGTNLVVDDDTVNRLYNTDSGYVVSETDPTHMLADTLIFTAE